MPLPRNVRVAMDDEVDLCLWSGLDAMWVDTHCRLVAVSLAACRLRTFVRRRGYHCFLCRGAVIPAMRWRLMARSLSRHALTANAREWILNQMVNYQSERLDRIFTALADPTQLQSLAGRRLARVDGTRSAEALVRTER